MKNLLIIVFVFSVNLSIGQYTWEPVGDKYIGSQSSYFKYAAGNDNDLFLFFKEDIELENYNRLKVLRNANGVWGTLNEEYLTTGDGVPLALAIDNHKMPHVIYYDYDLKKVLYRYYNGEQWSAKTNILDVGTVPIQLVFDSENIPYISFLEPENYYSNLGKIKVKKLINNVWTDLSSDLPKIDFNDPFDFFLDSQNIPVIIYSDIFYTYNDNGEIILEEKKASAIKITNGKWEYMGSRGFTSTGDTFLKSVYDSNNSIFVLVGVNYASTTSNNKLLKYDGISWTAVEFLDDFIKSSDMLSIDNNDKLYLGNRSETRVYDSNFKSTTLYSGVVSNEYNMIRNKIGTPYLRRSEEFFKLVGDKWEFVSKGAAIRYSQIMDVKIVNNIPYVLLRDKANQEKLVLRKYTDNKWESVGEALGKGGSISYSEILSDSKFQIYIAYKEHLGDGKYNTVVRCFKEGLWVSLVDKMVGIAVNENYNIDNNDRLLFGVTQNLYPAIYDALTLKKLYSDIRTYTYGENWDFYFDSNNDVYAFLSAGDNSLIKFNKDLNYWDKYGYRPWAVGNRGAVLLKNNNEIYVSYESTRAYAPEKGSVIAYYKDGVWSNLGEIKEDSYDSSVYDLFLSNSGELYACKERGHVKKFDGQKWDIISTQLKNNFGKNVGFYNDSPLYFNVINGQIYMYSLKNKSDQLSTEGNLNIDLSNDFVYPNPVEDVLYCNRDYSYVMIYDYLGRLLQRKEVMNKKIDLSDIPSGNYILKLKSDNTTETIKIVKK